MGRANDTSNDGTVQLTLAQAIVRWLANQYIVVDADGGKVEQRLFGGGFGIFGHGNVPCLGEALYQHREAFRCTAGKTNRVWVLLQPAMPNIICDSA